MESGLSLEVQLARLMTLPSLESVASRVIALGENPDPTAEDILTLAENDPSIAAVLLRVANSPLHAQRRLCSSLRQAVRELTERAALSVMLESVDPIDRLKLPPSGFWHLIWLHAKISALASLYVGRALGEDRLDELYLAGLLQDLGTIALIKARPERYAIELTRIETLSALPALERAELGRTRSNVGIWLARHWRLPPFITQALKIRQSHGPIRENTHAETTRLASVAIGNLIADWCIDKQTEQGHSATTRISLGMSEGIDLLLIRLHVLATRFGVDVTKVTDCLPQIGNQVDGFKGEFIEPGWTVQQRKTFNEKRAFILRLRRFHKQRMIEKLGANSSYLQTRNQHLEEAARRDTMTGLYNRAYFNDILERELRLIDKHGVTFSVALIDLDTFKGINDNYGHPIGDRCLIEVAKALQTHIRDTDIVARFGGDEFALLLPGADVSNTLQLCQRLLAAIKECAFKDDDGIVLSTSASIGLITPESFGQAPTKDMVLWAADKALYAAKRDGGNRVRVYAEETLEV